MANEGSAVAALQARAKPALRSLALIATIFALGLLLVMASDPAGADPVSPLAVTKTDSSDPVLSGSQLTYTITTVNTGGAKVSNVILTDQVNHLAGLGTPPQLVLTTTKGTCSQSFVQTYYLVTCNAGALAGGQGFTVTIRGIVTAPGGTTINNTASVAATKTAQNFNTVASQTTLVAGGPGPTLADLTINKAGPSSAVISTAMAPLYTLTVNNIGGANATGVKVVDTVPAGVTAISATGNSLFTCSLAGQTVTCSGGRVNAGSNATIQINGTTPAAPGTIANTAVVDPNNTVQEGNELNNTSATVTTTITTAPAAPKLAITKTDAPDPVVPGATLTYTIVVTNTGNGPQARADDVVMVDSTQGLEASSLAASGFVGAEPTDCDINGFQVNCSPSAPGRKLEAGQVMTIIISGQVVASAGTNLINTATVTGNIKNQGVINSATATTEVRPGVDLTITKADSPDPVCARSWPGPGGVCQGGLTYTFVVGNSGTDIASDVALRDELPAGMIFDSYANVDGGGFACSIDPGDPKPNVVKCTGGTVPPASTRTVTFLLVAPPTVGTVTNQVWVDPNNAIYEADETNNTFSINTQVITGIDLTILKCDEAGVAAEPVPLPLECPAGVPGFDPIATSGNLTYTLIVENIGTQDATNIRVRDYLPAGTIFRSVEGDNGFQCSYNSSGHFVECYQGALLGTASESYNPPAGTGYAPPIPGPQGPDQAKITIRAFAMPIVGTMHNESKVDPLHEIAEANESNNIEFEDTTVTIGDFNIGAFNELTIDKVQTDPIPDADTTIDSDDVATSGNLTYTITVQNTGTDPAVGVVVRDFLPAGAIFRQATADNGLLCSHAGGVVNCTGGTLGGQSNLLPGIDDTAVVTILVFAPPIPGIFTNQAIVDPDNAIPEGNEFNNADSVDTEVAAGGVNAFNELTIVKAQTDPVPDADVIVDAEDVATNGNLTYTLTIGNTGSDPVTGVHVRDFLPEGARFRQATADNNFLCTHADGVVNCVGGTLDTATDMVPGVDDTSVITIKLFAPPIPGIVTNQSIVDPANTIPEGNEFNNASLVDTEVAVGGVNAFNELTVDKTDDIADGVDDHVTPGGPVTYTLVVENTGSDPAFFVKVRDFLPANSTLVSAFDTAPGAGAFTCGHLNGVVDCINGTIAAGGQRSIQITILAPTDIEPLVPDKSNIFIDMINQAKVDPDDEIPEGNETNNNDVEITRVKSDVNLTIDKSGPESASQSTEDRYELEVANDGTATAFGVKVRDALPVGLIPLNVTTGSSNNFICQVLQNPVNVVECEGDLNPSQVIIITIDVFITLESGTLDNEACIDPDDEMQEYNEIDNCNTQTTVVQPGGEAENETLNPGSCSDTIDNDGDTLVDAADPGCIPPAPDISINKSADSSTGTPGQTLTYTLNVQNVGATAAATPITITDTLPSAVTFVNATGTNGFTCSFTAPDVTCTDPGSGLAIGGNTVITIQVTVDPKESGAGAGSCTDTLDNDSDTFVDEADPDCTLPFTNTAIVATVTGETNTGNNTDSVITSMGASPAALSIVSFEDLPDPINKGQTLEYTLIAVNGGTGDANGVEILIEDVIPGGGGVTFVGAAGSNGFQCTFSSPDVTCTGNMESGGFTIITIQILIGASAPLSLTATATIDPTDAFTEVDESDNSMQQVTTVTGSICSSCIDLVMGSILDTPDPATPGGSVKLIVTAGNAGDLGTTGACGTPPCVLIRIVVPAPDLDFTGYSATGGFTCADTNGDPDIDIIECTGELDAGEGVIITLDVDVTSASDTTVFTDADIDPDDALPEGVGAGDEFTNSNNSTTEDTFIDAP